MALRLYDPQLDKIAAGGKPVTDYLTDMLREWLNQNYEVSKYVRLSWQILSEAVRHPAGGNNAGQQDLQDSLCTCRTIIRTVTFLHISLIAHVMCVANHSPSEPAPHR